MLLSEELSLWITAREEWVVEGGEMDSVCVCVYKDTYMRVFTCMRICLCVYNVCVCVCAIMW